jgi:Rrf2 family protein
MAQLARRHDGRTLTRLEELAQREDVSANFLVQILNDLRRSGLVASRRGQSGGYLLARAPQDMTLRQVVEAVDPALLQCAVSGAGESGHAVRQAWERISSIMCKELEQITVASLASEQGGAMFYI